MRVNLLRVTKDGLELIANAARVSGFSDKVDTRSIAKMIVDNDYSSVLEHIYFTFDIEDISVALSRELLEHRIASHTARSTRYNEEDSFGYYIPREIRRDKNALKAFKRAMERANDAYKQLRVLGFKREEARYVLPMALHTRYVVTMNVRSLINFFMLRLCVRAAPEMRELAKKMYKLCLDAYPTIFEHIWCRGVTLGVCPENNARPLTCPFRDIVFNKNDTKFGVEEAVREIIHKDLRRRK